MVDNSNDSWAATQELRQVKTAYFYSKMANITNICLLFTQIEPTGQPWNHDVQAPKHSAACTPGARCGTR